MYKIFDSLTGRVFPKEYLTRSTANKTINRWNAKHGSYRYFVEMCK